MVVTSEAAGRPSRSGLVRRGYVLVAILGLPGLVVLLLGESAMRIFGATMVAVGCCLLVLIQRVRHPSDRPVAPEGVRLPVVIEVPRPVARLLLAMYLLVVLGAVAAAGHALLEPEGASGDRRGGAFFGVVLLSLPSAIRLARGGRRRWRLELDDRGIHYRGGRREEFMMWRDLRRVTSDEHDTHLVLTHDKRWHGDVFIPIVAYDVEPSRLVELVTSAQETARRT